jgi:hypothetical protein
MSRIYYIATRAHRYTLKRWFDPPPGPRDPEVVPVAYDQIGRFAEHQLPEATYVFTDVDRLDAEGMQAAVGLADRIRATGGRRWVANWPNRVWTRTELLSRLHARGANDFACYRFGEHRSIARFPVFLRVLGRHGGPATWLLGDRTELDSALRQLLARGTRRDDILVVEFLDSDRVDGRYLTYGAFCAWGRVFPADITFSDSWIAKYNARHEDAGTARFEADWVTGNPHAEAIAAVFRDAGVDWGRMDYTLRNGRLQVFEINTNPDLISDTTWANEARREAHVIPVELANIRAAFRQLAAPPPNPGGRRYGDDGAEARADEAPL